MKLGLVKRFLLASTIVLVGNCYASAAFSQNSQADKTVDSDSVNNRIGAGFGSPKIQSEVQADLAFGAFQRGKYLTAFKLALPRAKLGDPAAQTLIAEMYDKGLGVPKNQKESTAWYALAAENNDLEAQFAYSIKLLEGKYVKVDKKKAHEMMRSAAKGGHATASFNLGQIILSERPTSAGAVEAAGFFHTAADGGVADAYYTLAKLYESGRLKGYPEMETAQSWMLKAAKAGIDTAQVELGIWLVNGKAGDTEPTIGFQWMKRAAHSGNVIGQNRIAKMLMKGIGTKTDIIEGAKWAIIARRAGLNDSWLDEQIGGLEENDLRIALEAANRWPAG